DGLSRLARSTRTRSVVPAACITLRGAVRTGEYAASFTTLISEGSRWTGGSTRPWWDFGALRLSGTFWKLRRGGRHECSDYHGRKVRQRIVPRGSRRWTCAIEIRPAENGR